MEELCVDGGLGVSELLENQPSEYHVENLNDVAYRVYP